MNTPHVSVLMCVYNGARFLRKAIDSILSQTFADFEFIIVDDASDDDSPRILASYDDRRMRMIRNASNIGLTRSLNVGLRAATAPWVARQDADDVSHPDRLQQQFEFLDRNDGVALLGTQSRMIDESDRPVTTLEYRKATSDEAIRWQMAIDSAFVHTSVVFRTAPVRDDLGGYDETFTNGQDADLWSRLADRHRLANLPVALVDSRVHAQQISWRKNFVTPEAILRGEGIYRRNLRRLVGEDVVSEEWIRSYVGAYVARPLRDAQEARFLLGGMRAIARAFFASQPSRQAISEFRAVLAGRFLYLASYFRGAYDAVAAQAIASAYQYAPATTTAQLKRYAMGRVQRTLRRSSRTHS